MSSLLLTKSDQGTVVFHIWRNLSYGIRLFLSFIFILVGIAIQYYFMNVFPGIILVFAGNLLLLVKGYDNRIKLGSFEHVTEWVATDQEHLNKIVELNKKVRKWDISALDITSGLGGFLFFLLLVAVLVICAVNPFHTYNPLIILAANIVILLVPHWVTGVRRITTAPALVNKIKVYQDITGIFTEMLKEDNVSFLMLLKGKDKKMPADVKMKIKFKNQTDDFLGMYAQISVNNVQGKDYPYFYMVLVAKESSKLLSSKLKNITMPTNVISEFSRENDAEILVIRQYTTNKSGYFTNGDAIQVIFETGLRASQKLF
jgi:hypothetical protein